MKRSLPLFLVFFGLLVASASVLLLVLPASLGADATTPAWIPTALGALVAVSTLCAALVRPNWTDLSSHEAK